MDRIVGKARTTLGAAGVALLALGALGCASGGGGGGEEDRGGGGSIQGTTITSADLEGSRYSSIYDVMRQHRLIEFRDNRMYLQSRGPSSLQAPAPMLLVVDGTQVGTGVQGPLQSLSVDEVDRIQILQPTQATTRYGTNAGGGAVVVTTKRG